jgi:hypothetical protein
MWVSWLMVIGLGFALFAVSYSRRAMRPRSYALLIGAGIAASVYSLIISGAQGYVYRDVLTLVDYPQAGRSIVLAYGVLVFAALRGMFDLLRRIAQAR